MSPSSDIGYKWLELSLIKGLGSIAFKQLLERFGDPEYVFQAPLSELMNVEGIKKRTALNIRNRAFSSDPLLEMKCAEEFGVKIITFSEPAYPRQLKEIYDPPMVLYTKGEKIPNNLTFVAIVGSRNASHYGLTASEELAQGVARRGLGVISGMARGIDSAAHWGCINGKGFTIAVLGTGIDNIYPSSNKKLFHKITEIGVVISEFPFGTRPVPNNFPIRNRIISGISKGVIVVEATKNSGSLITASLALDQGREVFAVPGSINSFKSSGCHFLIKQGARLIENSDDVLDELGLNIPHVPKSDTFNRDQTPIMDEHEKNIYDLLGEYPLHIDDIAIKGKLGTQEAASTLTRMELKGMIRQLPGKMFVR